MAGKFTFEEEARSRELHPSSAGDVCGILDQLLTWAIEEKRQNEIISQVDSFNLALKTLEFYLQTKPNADNWMDRTYMMNLVEGLTYVYPQIAANGQIISLVSKVNEQPEKDFSPFDDFARRRARMSEKDAAKLLISRTFPDVTEGILESV